MMRLMNRIIAFKMKTVYVSFSHSPTHAQNMMVDKSCMLNAELFQPTITDIPRNISDCRLEKHNILCSTALDDEVKMTIH